MMNKACVHVYIKTCQLSRASCNQLVVGQIQNCITQVKESLGTMKSNFVILQMKGTLLVISNHQVRMSCAILGNGLAMSCLS